MFNGVKRIKQFIVYLFKGLAVCSLAFLGPSVLGDIVDMSELFDIRTKPLFMFWGGMYYMHFLKKRQANAK